MCILQTAEITDSGSRHTDEGEIRHGKADLSTVGFLSAKACLCQT